ncbi:hypothetical protein ACFWEH_06350 [Streptomyces anulatus]|uniref:hypothetical protein n=1 Tax=Streptomyces TaxID=1883 RepID=UPI0018E99AE4|nr:hypothetical protein [Streptomyces sp. TSRI0395]
MVETVLQIVMQMASGAAATAGTEMGQTISTMVRDRLEGTDRGSAALRAAEERPDDPEAVDELRTLLQAEVDADQGFAERLAAALTALADADLTRTTTGSITLQGSTVRGRNTFALGPVTFNNTRNVRLSLVAGALVFVALAVLGVYGGRQLIVADDSAHSPTGTPSKQADPSSADLPGDTTKTTPETASPTPTVPPWDISEIEESILDSSDVPEYWVTGGWNDVFTVEDFPDDWPCDELGPQSMPGHQALLRDMGFKHEGVHVSIHKHDTQAKAKEALAFQRVNQGQCLHGRSVEVTSKGDETAGFEHPERSVVYIREGKYLIEVMSSGDLPNGPTAHFARRQYDKLMKAIAERS